jgi:hypothetical protein
MSCPSPRNATSLFTTGYKRFAEGLPMGGFWWGLMEGFMMGVDWLVSCYARD